MNQLLLTLGTLTLGGSAAGVPGGPKEALPPAGPEGKSTAQAARPSGHRDRQEEKAMRRRGRFNR